MNATVLRLPWFSILLVVRPRKMRRQPVVAAARPRVRIAGLR